MAPLCKQVGFVVLAQLASFAAQSEMASNFKVDCCRVSMSGGQVRRPEIPDPEMVV